MDNPVGYEHEPETVWKAQELYCMDRLSFDRVAEVTGIAASTLKRWADKYHWREKREEIAQLESDIRVNTIRGRATVLEKLLTAADGKEASQAAFAVASLESLALKQQELAAAGKIPSPAAIPTPKIATRAEAAAALREAVERKLGLALADPATITSATVKDVMLCLSLVEDLEKSLPKAQEEEQVSTRGLSADLARRIEEALGLGKKA